MSTSMTSMKARQGLELLTKDMGFAQRAEYLISILADAEHWDDQGATVSKIVNRELNEMAEVPLDYFR